MLINYSNCSGFIDFFVHDILDYTILNEDNSNFQKHISVFDVREAVNQILQLQEDKIEMKKIQIVKTFNGFDEQYKVKTDMKRV